MSTTKTPSKKPAKKAATKKPAAKTEWKPGKKLPPAKARRLEEIAESKKGLFAIDPTLLSVEEGFNKRQNYGDLRQLADDIAANGLDQPLKIRKIVGTETIYIVSGHRRHRAITEILIPEGRWQDPENPKKIRTVDCYAEPQGTSKIDRLVSQVCGNTGLAYTLLEKSAVYQEILAEDPALKPADLSRRFGETKQAVSDALRLANDGCKELHECINNGTMAASTAILIIKQAGTDHSAQKTLLVESIQAATSANSRHVTPKHIPGATPDKPKQDTDSLWSYETSAAAIKWNKHDVCEDPHTLTATPGPGIERLEITTASHKGKWFCGYDYQTKGGSYAGGGCAPSRDDTAHPDESTAIRCAWDRICTRITHAAKSHPKASALIGHATKLGHDLSASYPTGIPWDESVFAAALAAPPPPETDSQDEDPDQDPEDLDTEAAPASFRLYVIDDVPETPVSEDSPEYHETDRLVLENPLTHNFDRLHLLCAATPKGVAYGYRINDTEILPDITGPHLNASPESGFKAMLAAANGSVAGDPDLFRALNDLLYDALCRYYPEEGAPEEPEHLTFVGASESQTDKPETGYKAILNAKPSGGGGGGFGGGKTGYAAPDKQMEKINDLLEDLAANDEEAEQRISIEERMTTVEITLGILRNERSITDLRNYLTGKA
jgi:hypothetical protein